MIKKKRKQNPTIAPPVTPGDVPQFSKFDAYTFQKLCRELFQEEESITTCDEYATSGQSEYGIDLLANRKDGSFEVGQCKCSEKFYPADIINTSNEFLKNLNGKWKGIDIKRYILFVASDLSSNKTQDTIINEKARFLEKNILYEAWGNPVLTQKLRPHPAIVNEYFKGSDWVELICGPSPQIKAADPSFSSDYAFSKAASILSKDADSTIEGIRISWRTEGVEVALSKLLSLKGDKDRWELLSAETKAKALRIEASAYLAKEEIPKAIDLQKKAHELDPDYDDILLRANVAQHTEGLEAAGKILEGKTSPDAIVFRATIHLLLGQYQNCREILNSCKEDLSSNAGALRIEGFLHRAENDFQSGLAMIEKAITIEPDWIELKIAKALFYYQSALLPKTLDSSPNPHIASIPWLYVKRDDEAISRLREAEQLWEQVLKCTTVEAERRYFEGWKLSCLACDFEKQDLAENYCRELLDNNSAHIYAWLWTLNRGYCRNDLTRHKKILEDRLRSGSDNTEILAALIICYAAVGEENKGLKLLHEKQSSFVRTEEKEFHQFWKAHFFAQRGDRKNRRKAIRLLDSFPDLEQKRSVEAHALKVSRKDATLSKDLISLNLRSFKETEKPSFLLDACKAAADGENWVFILEHQQKLFQLAPTHESVRLCIYALYNTQHFNQCLELANESKSYFRHSELPPDIQRIITRCKENLGNLKESGRELSAEFIRLLQEKDPKAFEVARELAQNRYFAGDYASLGNVANTLIRTEGTPPELLVEAAHHLKYHNPVVARILLEKVKDVPLSDSHIMYAYTLSKELGVDLDDRSFIQRLNSISNQPDSGVMLKSISELKDFILSRNKEKEEAYRHYSESNLSYHFLGENPAYLYHRRMQLAESMQSTIPPFLFVRYGGLRLIEGLPEKKLDWQLHIDISSLLLMERLNLHEHVLNEFGPYFIPFNWSAAFQDMMKEFHIDPVTAATSKKIVDLVEGGSVNIQNADSNLPLTEEDQLLVDDLGKDVIQLCEKLLSENGFLVQFLPLRSRSDLDTEIDVPDKYKHVICNIGAIWTYVKENGNLTNGQIENAQRKLGQYGGESANIHTLKSGSKVHIHGNITELFDRAGILEVLCDVFDVSIDEYIYNENRTTLRTTIPQNTENTDWLKNLSSSISRRIENDEVNLLPKSDKPSDYATDAYRVCLEDLLTGAGVASSSGKPIVQWIDDRFCTAFNITHNSKVASAYEITKILYLRGHLSREQYYEKLIKLRAGLAVYCPIEKGELLYHLNEANTSDGRLIESTNLAVLKRYFSATILNNGLLQVEKRSADGGKAPGEGQYLIDSLNSVADSILEVWRDTEYDYDKALAKAEWLYGNVFIDYLGALHSWKGRNPDTPSYKFLSLSLNKLLAEAILLPHCIGNLESPRYDYLDWFYGRMLRPRFQSNPSLKKEVVRWFHDYYKLLVPEDMRKSMASTIALFVHDMPKEMKSVFEDNASLLDEFNIPIVHRMGLGGRLYETKPLVKAIGKLINQEVDTVIVKDLDGKDEIFTAKTNVGQIEIYSNRMNGKTSTLLEGKEFKLLHNSADVREQGLREMRELFEYTDDEFEKTLKDINSTKDAIDRFSMFMDYKANAAAEYYRELYQEISGNKSFSYSQFRPPSAKLLKYIAYTSFNAVENDQVEKNEAELETSRMNKDEILIAAEKLSHFPVPLPENLISSFKSITADERAEVLTEIGRKAQTPIGQFQRLSLQAINENLLEDGARIVKSTDWPMKGEVKAFIHLLSWVEHDFNWWEDTDHWSAREKLIVIWYHASRLYKIFIARGIHPKSIHDIFENAPQVLHYSIFQCKEEEKDISHPSSLKVRRVILSGLQYIWDTSQIELDDDSRNWIVSEMFRRIQESESDNTKKILEPEILLDHRLPENELKSWLCTDYLSVLAQLMGKQRKEFGFSEDFAIESIDSIIVNGNDLGYWIYLKETVQNYSISGELKTKLDDMLSNISFEQILRNTRIDLFGWILETIFLRVKAGQTNKFKEHLKEEIIGIFRTLGSLQFESENESQHLILMALSIYFGVDAPRRGMDEKEVERISTEIIKLNESYGILRYLKNINFLTYIENFPADYGKHLWKIVLTLRSIIVD